MKRLLRPVPQHLRKSQLEPDAAEVAGPDRSNESVAGEEDPGAALEPLGPSLAWPDGWCPWPREWSA